MTMRIAQPFGRSIPLATLARLKGQRVKHSQRRVVVLVDPVVFSVDGIPHVIDTDALTDLASAPWFLHWLVNPLDDPWTTCAVIHDHAYAALATTRSQADRWWREAAIELDVSQLVAWLTWAGLRLGGWPAWRHNQRKLQELGPAWRYLTDKDT